MLMGLNGELTEGESITLTLVFEDGSEKMVAAPVRKMKMRMGSKHDMPMESHSQQ
jgi:copper(I)-binding protein